MSLRPAIAVLAVVAALGLLAFGLLSKGSSAVAVGDPAPVRRLPLLEGSGDGSIAEYRGRWVLVNIWSSWCGPCHQEAPILERFQRRYGGPRFTILGIDSRDLSSDGRGFVRRYGFSFPQLRDGNGDAAHDYGTTGVPENFLVGPGGRIRLLDRGPLTVDYLESAVAPLVKGRS